MCCDLVTATFSELFQVSAMHDRLDIVDYLLTEARLNLCVKHLVSHTCLVRTDSYMHGELYCVFITIYASTCA